MKLAAAIAVLAALMVLAGAAVAATPKGKGGGAPTCHGRPATIVGTDGDDVIHGTPDRDVVWGGPGNDRIYGSLGNDLICGGPGADLIHGGRGNDDLDGGAGNDDQVYGDLGDDQANGGAGSYDEVGGGLGIDVVNGGPGAYDLVHGDYGFDRMSGGAGGGDIASFATKVAGGKGTGVWASLPAHRALGDGHDELFGFESIEGSALRDTLIGNKQVNQLDGGAGDDHIRGGGGADVVDGGQGSDRCSGAKGRTISCGKEAAPVGSAYVQLDPALGGGAGLQVVGGAGRDGIVVAFGEASDRFGVSSTRALAAGPGCEFATADLKSVSCAADGPARWLMADLGPGDDGLRVQGSLLAVGLVRIAGGLGDDVIHGGPEDDLIESGPGADKLYGGAGADGLVGGVPGPTYLYGGPDGDLLAAGGGCSGGALVGGPGRDDASFAEVGTHPGILEVSFPLHSAWLLDTPGCARVHLSPSDEDMEGSFGPDVLVGNSRANAILGQPGRDIFIGNGGDDVIDARDGHADRSIQCAPGLPPHPKPKSRGGGLTKPTGHPEGRGLTDPFDPPPFNCAIVKHGTPVPGLNG